MNGKKRTRAEGGNWETGRVKGAGRNVVEAAGRRARERADRAVTGAATEAG